MNKKKTVILITGILLTSILTGCFNRGPDPELIELKKRLETIEKERQDQIKAKEEEEKVIKEIEEEEEKAELEKELEELKAKVNEPKVKEEKVNKPKLPRIKFGPGNGNNLQGLSEGSLKIHTRSANGKLTLRDSPNQSGNKILEIANGTEGIYYYNRVKDGEYVWYEVEYLGNTGYLRGDYVDRF